MKAFLITTLTVLCMNGFAATKNCEDAKTFPEITKADLQKQIQSNTAFVVDVNGSQSYAKKHIDTAVDFETLKTDLARTLPPDKNSLLVFYCGGPSCVAWKKGAVEACKIGYTNVKHFKPGIKGWQ